MACAPLLPFAFARALFLLCIQTDNVPNRDAVRAAGGLGALVNALTTHAQSAAVAQQACAALWNAMVCEGGGGG